MHCMQYILLHCCFHYFELKTSLHRPRDRPTERQTDRHTDGIELLSQLKNQLLKKEKTIRNHSRISTPAENGKMG